MPTNSKEYMRQYDHDNKLKYNTFYVHPKECHECQQFVPPRYWSRHIKTKKYLLNVRAAADEPTASTPSEGLLLRITTT